LIWALLTLSNLTEIRKIITVFRKKSSIVQKGKLSLQRLSFASDPMLENVCIVRVKALGRL